MLGHCLATAEAFDPARLFVIVGRDSEQVEQAFSGRAEFVLQAEQRGTGHAVLQAEPKLADFEGDVLILYADTPLLRVETLMRMQQLKQETGAGLVMLSALLPLPGRVVRDSQGRVERIVESTDATPEELEIEEGNTGVYLVDCGLLREALGQLRDDNEQGELYITDVVEHAVSAGQRVEALRLEDARECLGVNTRSELAQAAAVMRERTAERCMLDGVTLVDPAHTYLDVDVEIGRDSLIEPGCVITAGSVIGEGVHIKAHCTIEQSRLDDGVIVGPSAHLRPNTHLMEGVRIGNFVEVKNSSMGPGAKADHLSYIGDADVGAGASFGCGSIVVNYDGIEKHRTTVGEKAFIGCNSNLVAPVTIEPGAFIAAGSTITTDVPAEALSVARARQKNLEGWVAKRRKQSEKKSAK
jgi:bifunctional UDP-N-acetylglucosamine pyrophosphorylase/glucosamine-1-phosphate N-acetyltransferase